MNGEDSFIDEVREVREENRSSSDESSERRDEDQEYEAPVEQQEAIFIEEDPDLEVPERASEQPPLHCFYVQTSQNMLTERDQLDLADGGIPKCWLVFGIKQENRGKLDSHRLFFNGFCTQIQPHFCIMIDCGTTFTTEAFYAYMQLCGQQPSIGGVAIEVEIEQKRNPLVLAQFVEYKIDQLLKTAEGLYGLVQILPGTMQCLRWNAIKGNPLKMYCKGTESIDAVTNEDRLGIFRRNVFLTQDKLMTILLMLGEDSAYKVAYLPGVHCKTDVPSSTTRLLKQRRRWLNGGFSTSVYACGLFCKKCRRSQMTKKECCLSFLLFLQILYYLLQIFVQCTVVGDIATFVYFVSRFENILLGESYKAEIFKWPPSILCIIFGVATIAMLLVAQLGNSNNPKVKKLYEIFTILFAILNVIKYTAILVVFIYTFQDEQIHELATHTLMLVLSTGFFFLKFLALFLIRPCHSCSKLHVYVSSFLVLVLLSKTFFYMLKIYLVTNYHDVSWGSRPSSLITAQRVKYKYLCQNVLLLAFWLIFQTAVLYLFFFSQFRFQILLFSGISVLVWSSIRVIQSFLFWHCKYNCSLRRKIYGDLKAHPNRNESNANLNGSRVSGYIESNPFSDSDPDLSNVSGTPRRGSVRAAHQLSRPNQGRYCHYESSQESSPPKQRSHPPVHQQEDQEEEKGITILDDAPAPKPRQKQLPQVISKPGDMINLKKAHSEVISEMKPEIKLGSSLGVQDISNEGLKLRRIRSTGQQSFKYQKQALDFSEEREPSPAQAWDSKQNTEFECISKIELQFDSSSRQPAQHRDQNQEKKEEQRMWAEKRDDIEESKCFVKQDDIAVEEVETPSSKEQNSQVLNALILAGEKSKKKKLNGISLISEEQLTMNGEPLGEALASQKTGVGFLDSDE